MNRDLDLPAHFERRFSMHLYWVSHGLLLLRSGKSNTESTRVDILFRDVTWMALPAWFDGLRITAATPEDLPLRLPTPIQREVHLRRVYRLTAEEIDHFVVAGRVSVAEDERSYFEDSLLVPDLHVANTFPS